MIENVKITATMFGKEDHGIMTCQIWVEGDGWGCCYGGYALDGFDKSKNKRYASPNGLQAIIEILNTLEVETWEKLQGQYIRVETSGWGGKITKIGHLMKDKWFSFEEFFAKCKESTND